MIKKIHLMRRKVFEQNLVSFFFWGGGGGSSEGGGCVESCTEGTFIDGCTELVRQSH